MKMLNECLTALCELKYTVIAGSHQSPSVWCEPSGHIHSLWHSQYKTTSTLYSWLWCGWDNRSCWRTCICFQESWQEFSLPAHFGGLGKVWSGRQSNLFTHCQKNWTLNKELLYFTAYWALLHSTHVKAGGSIQVMGLVEKLGRQCTTLLELMA